MPRSRLSWRPISQQYALRRIKRCRQNAATLREIVLRPELPPLLNTDVYEKGFLLIEPPNIVSPFRQDVI